VHLVVANILSSRKDRVLLVHRPGGQLQAQQILRPPEDADIELLLVARVVEMHGRFQRGGAATAAADGAAADGVS
jgi:hypothetical protein